jgi:hypothetical protein
MCYGSTYIFAMLVSGTFGMASLIASAHGFPRLGTMAHLTLVAFATLLAIAIHEAGRWLAGAAQGFRCLRFLVGPIEIAPVDSGWRIRLVPFHHAGVVYQVPSSFANFRLQKATSLAAGPCVSLVACLFFATLALRAHAAFPFWFWMVNAQMCLIGVLQLFPVRFGQAESEGLQLLTILRGGPRVDAIQRDLLADSVNHTPLRPRDWPVDLLGRLASTGARYHLYMAYIHALDSGNISGAWAHLSALLDSWLPGDGPQYALEAAYFLAFFRGDEKRARQWLSLETRLPDDALRLRAEAAVEWVAGRTKKARERIEQAELTLRAGLVSGYQAFELDCLQAMREELLSQNPSHPHTAETQARHPLANPLSPSRDLLLNPRS